MQTYEPKKLITRIFEFSALFALSCFLIRAGVRFLLEIWPIAAIVPAAVIAVVVAYRVWRRKRGGW